ncbi:MAG: 50S ribosomal protein L17 [Deltaproteobacteria bacterium]|nr:50S ribosomal protein L17 [Deltaproteobacteria bacterium]
MRHNVDFRKLGRTSSHRTAMLANMAASLVIHDRIKTTLPKAKELKRIADQIVTLSKRGTLHARRLALALIRQPEAVALAFDSLGKRFEGRNGGYTRIYKTGPRNGDAAPMAILEYLKETRPNEATTGEAPKKKAAKTAKAVKAPVEKTEKKKGTLARVKAAAKKAVKKED